jgi:hypothetical protein
MFYIFCKLINRKKKPLAFLLATGMAVGFICLLYYEMNSAASYNFIKPFVQHNIICDVPDSTFGSLNENYSGNINSVISFVKENPFEFCRLCFKRFISFWSLTRSFYTSIHNWLLRLFFYPLYLFAIVGFVRLWNKYKQMATFCFITIAVFTLSVMLTCDEWSSRFIMPILPIIIFFAAQGIFVSTRKLIRKDFRSTAAHF